MGAGGRQPASGRRRDPRRHDRHRHRGTAPADAAGVPRGTAPGSWEGPRTELARRRGIEPHRNAIFDLPSWSAWRLRTWSGTRIRKPPRCVSLAPAQSPRNAAAGRRRRAAAFSSPSVSRTIEATRGFLVSGTGRGGSISVRGSSNLRTGPAARAQFCVAWNAKVSELLTPAKQNEH